MKAYGKPLTLTRIRLAYRDYGLVPVTGVWVRGDKGCCALGVVMIEHGGWDTLVQADAMEAPTAIKLVAYIIGESPYIVSAFLTGFDGNHEFDPNLNYGKHKGRALWRASRAFELGKETHKELIEKVTK